MLKRFYPGVRYDSAYAIDFSKYYELGYRAILFDIDNTLVKHDAPADGKARALFDELKDIGFKTCLVSNNHEPRVKSFADAVGCRYVFLAEKPSTKGFEEAMQLLGVTRSGTMMVGDQLFTDMWGANRTGILAVHTKLIAPDPLFHIRLKRAGEHIVMLFYRIHEKLHPAPKYLK